MVLVPYRAVMSQVRMKILRWGRFLCRHHKFSAPALMDPGDILAKFLRALALHSRSSAGPNFKYELVAADPDQVAIGQGGAGPGAPASDVDTVGRTQIADHKTAPGVDDDRVVAADIVIVENDVVIGTAPDSVRPLQWVALPVVAT